MALPRLAQSRADDDHAQHLLEIAWTVIPILILVFIAIPSFRLLYYGDKATDAAFTVKVTGHQWFWSYDYPDQGNFTVESRILAEADRVKQKPEVPRLLAVDEEMVIPKGTTIRIIGTAADFHARLDRVRASASRRPSSRAA